MESWGIKKCLQRFKLLTVDCIAWHVLCSTVIWLPITQSSRLHLVLCSTKAILTDLETLCKVKLPDWIKVSATCTKKSNFGDCFYMGWSTVCSLLYSTQYISRYSFTVFCRGNVKSRSVSTCIVFVQSKLVSTVLWKKYWFGRTPYCTV